MRLTAAAVSRNFTAVITRAGRRLGLIGPAPTGDATALNTILAAHRPDEDFARDVHTTRGLLTPGPNASWPDA
ncbi:prevent-host-death family protein [Streptomyces cocklensis]|jgi:ABC-type branched-subunit amino acid transport system ATPase component|uniref:Prevent-host-death family protein n=1 Tax=Actinacidiphila cocklensis TaxID=887465 RepID=A0A9W4E7G0_9ACTN|nr:prevent-host-death family protein [Actinacidiphila cocklensis]MDD1063001.1 prevent-host-death family protein [Actinacidiphila cocklensis]WSX78597.1 prevent-host-death family protein [Streptomyces sp. NBC_00899]CAG6394796.1 Prevent-host-death family protein [Actinacidiphila cocklensis]